MARNPEFGPVRVRVLQALLNGPEEVARNPEFGPVRVRVLQALLNGPEEDPREEKATQSGADRSEAARGGQDAGRGDRGPRGREGVGGFRGDLPSLARSVRRDEGRRCEAVEGARAREPDAQADRREQRAGDRG